MQNQGLKNISYEIRIHASAVHVYKCLTEHGTYEEWTGTEFPGSTYEGQWKQGEKIKFCGPDGSGTMAEFVELVPEKIIKAVHVAMLIPGGIEDRDSDMAKSWIGITEDYYFSEEGGVTTLRAEMKLAPQWAQMFEDAWTKTLGKLKEICER